MKLHSSRVGREFRPGNFSRYKFLARARCAPRHEEAVVSATRAQQHVYRHVAEGSNHGRLYEDTRSRSTRQALSPPLPSLLLHLTAFATVNKGSELAQFSRAEGESCGEHLV